MENSLQAVIIADNLHTEFDLIRASGPSCLIPVVNCPLIFYAIEFLVLNKVK